MLAGALFGARIPLQWGRHFDLCEKQFFWPKLLKKLKSTAASLSPTCYTERYPDVETNYLLIPMQAGRRVSHPWAEGRFSVTPPWKVERACMQLTRK